MYEEKNLMFAATDQFLSKKTHKRSTMCQTVNTELV